MEYNPKKIVIDDKNTSFMVQLEFNQLFPYLKIEFFSLSNKTRSLNGNKISNQPNGPLGGYRNFENEEQIVISPDMSVATLEEKFMKIYGLKAQVLRKSGKTWLETTVTDVWTLEEQNSQGEALSKNINS